MATVKWELESWLKAHGYSRYDLARAIEGEQNAKRWQATIYRMKNPARLDLQTLAKIITGLRKLTGEEVTPNDLLSYEANFEPLDIETELQAWEDLQAEQNALMPNYELDEADLATIEPLNFTGGRWTINAQSN